MLMPLQRTEPRGFKALQRFLHNHTPGGIIPFRLNSSLELAQAYCHLTDIVIVFVSYRYIGFILLPSSFK